jgi:para-nitrobenzyl esterase
MMCLKTTVLYLHILCILLLMIQHTPTGVSGAGPLERLISTGLIKGGMFQQNQVYGWQSIPYAQPPIGNLRWKAPQPVTPWSNTVAKDTIAMPPQCPQEVSVLAADESCLYINVYRPTPSAGVPDDEVLPVIVWIHGGSYNAGGISTYPITNYALSARVVIVSIQYRLGALGFLALDEMANTMSSSGYVFNHGTRDQIMALKWTADNVHVFGGDRTHITVTGESAGASSVLIQTLQMENAGRFHAVAIESPGPALFFGMDRALQFGNEVSSQVGCGTTAGPTRMTCMNGKTGVELYTALQAAIKKYGLVSVPCVDGVILKDYPMTLVRHGKYLKDLTYLFGSNEFEGRLFAFGQFLRPPSSPVTDTEYDQAALQLFNNAYTKRMTLETLKDLYADARKTKGNWEAFSLMIGAGAIRCAVNTYADYMSQQGTTVYRYLFKQYMHSRPRAPLGSTHASEIPFVFNSPNTPIAATGYNFTYGGNAALAYVMNQDFANLAKTLGAPRSGWPKYDSVNRLGRVYDSLDSPGVVLLTDQTIHYDDCPPWLGVFDPTAPCSLHGIDVDGCNNDEGCQFSGGICETRGTEDKGSSALVVLLILLIVAVVAAIGYLIYRHMKAKRGQHHHQTSVIEYERDYAGSYSGAPPDTGSAYAAMN